MTGRDHREDVPDAFVELTLPERLAPAGRVLDAATAIANRAPVAPGKYVTDAKIPWRLIRELRDALDAMEVEWR
jgi:hypothetical protein